MSHYNNIVILVFGSRAKQTGRYEVADCLLLASVPWAPGCGRGFAPGWPQGMGPARLAEPPQIGGEWVKEGQGPCMLVAPSVMEELSKAGWGMISPAGERPLSSILFREGQPHTAWFMKRRSSLTNLFRFSEYIPELGDNGSIMGNLSVFQGGIWSGMTKPIDSQRPIWHVRKGKLNWD